MTKREREREREKEREREREGKRKQIFFRRFFQLSTKNRIIKK